MLIAPRRWPLNKNFGPAISEAAEPVQLQLKRAGGLRRYPRSFEFKNNINKKGDISLCQLYR
jgi:hypothetical protein